MYYEHILDMGLVVSWHVRLRRWRHIYWSCVSSFCRCQPRSRPVENRYGYHSCCVVHGASFDGYRARSYKNRRPDDGVALIDFGRLSRAMYCCYLISKITVTHRTRTRDVVTSSNTDMRTIRVGPTSPGDGLPVENGCKKTFTTGTRDVFYGLINSKNGKRSSFNRYVTVKG